MTVEEKAEKLRAIASTDNLDLFGIEDSLLVAVYEALTSPIPQGRELIFNIDVIQFIAQVQDREIQRNVQDSETVNVLDYIVTVVKETNNSHGVMSWVRQKLNIPYPAEEDIQLE